MYLHGFASGPDSKKASVFRSAFEKRDIPLTVPDLEDGDFENLTLTRQIEVVQSYMNARKGHRFGLIGSSMGGYVAALTAQLREEVSAIYLMAPAFNFLERWQKRLKRDFLAASAAAGLIKVFHYRYNKEMPLNTFIFEDARKWENLPLDRAVPTRIVHGVKDESVDIDESRRFAKDRPWSRLVELDSDHGLLDRVGWMVEDCVDFFRSENLL